MTAQKTYNFLYGKFRDKKANYQYEILKDIVERVREEILKEDKLSKFVLDSQYRTGMIYLSKEHISCLNVH